MSQSPPTAGESKEKNQEPSWTVLSLLEWTTNYLREHGSSSPRLDAEVLLAHARNCQRIQLYMAFDQPASAELRETFRELIKQRAKGTPVAYLVGSREFFSRSFEVNSDVLIPRPETEFVLITLVELLEKSGAKDAAVRIADIGTGSGILAISAALEFPAAEIFALDKSEKALAVSQANAQKHGVEQRIQFLHGDVGQAADSAAINNLDYVVSNPPYITKQEFEQLPRDVKDFEPAMALVAGDDGLDVIRPLVRFAEEKLKPGGYLICEISPQLEAKVMELLESAGAFEPGQVRRDLSQLPRVVYARRK